MIEILFLWVGLFLIFAGGSGICFAYFRFHATQPWRLKIDRDFLPAVTILIPTHNEEEVIEAKLENTIMLSYPKEKMEIILVDDASTDRTLTKVDEFLKRHTQLNIKVVKQDPRVGKGRVLNAALSVSTNNIIIVSDADSFWPSDILINAMPYLSDPIVGAVTGSGMIENTSRSWVTKGEINYLKSTSLLRLGESKIHSTIRFEGGFCAFKRSAFEKFFCESGADDSGTALDVVQKGFRTIFVPEATFVTDFPEDLKGKISVKARRGISLMWLWTKCLKLLVKGRLFLPRRIAIPEIFLFIFNPIVFSALIIVTLINVILYPIVFIPLVIALSVAGLFPTIRSYLIEIALDNVILFYSLILHIRGKKFQAWDKT